MTHVATLISNPGAAALDAAAVAHARDCLPSPAEPRWLAERIAADLPFSPNGANDNWADRLRQTLAGRPVDVVVQPNGERRKRLLVADMDSTMIGQECIDELADKVGLKARVAAITERAMRGDIAFEPALRERVALRRRRVVARAFARPLHARRPVSPSWPRDVYGQRRPDGAVLRE